MLYFREAGEGPPLVLLHGLFGSLENLGGLARHLAERFHVYSVDLPNHGRSPHQASVSLASMADTLFQWLTQQGLASPLVLGHSLGGKVAMELALSEPHRVARLVVIDIAPSGYRARHDAVFAGLQAINLKHLTSRAEAERSLQEFVPEAAVRSFLLKNLVKSSEGFEWRINLAGLTDSYPQLIAENRTGAFSGPTLFIKGGNSNYLEEAHRAAILDRFPRAQLKVIADTGHWVHAEKPKLVADLTARFFAD